MGDKPLDSLPLLKRVSRAFYLSIRVLPAQVRHPVGIAYLLARVADTISDTDALPAERRLESLIAFRNLIAHMGNSRACPSPLCRGNPCGCPPPPNLIAPMDNSRACPSPSRRGNPCGCPPPIQTILDAAGQGATPAERDLLQAARAILDLLNRLPTADRRLVSEIATRLTEGMEFDLTYFAASEPPSHNVKSLQTAADLDRYAYLVAGCVGEFWTRIIIAHTPALASWDVDRMTALGVRFGKALQLTNILRDAPRDLAVGRCYIPSEWLDELGIASNDLLNPDNGASARPALVRGIELALDHFADAERYLLTIPRRCVRLRLAAAWPLILGLATLERVAQNPRWLDPAARASVPRPYVYRMIALSLVTSPSNAALSAWIRALTRRVRAATQVPSPLTGEG